MKIPAWMIFAGICLAGLTGPAAAQCERHFYNHSSVQYSMVFTTGNGLCNTFVACTIAPHDTATIVYFPYPAGNVLINSSNGNHALGVTGCYIIHSGGTGDIAVNDPADGDVTTCGSDGWRCPAPSSIPAPRGQRK